MNRIYAFTGKIIFAFVLFFSCPALALHASPNEKPANLTPPVGTICGTANEGFNVTLNCPLGMVITNIVFASYGTPNGSCGSYTIGGCHAANSVSVVSALAIGQNSVTIPANNSTFGDPCGGTPKRLYIEAEYGLPATHLNFDGVDDIVSVSVPMPNPGSDNLSLEAWVYPTNISGVRSIIRKTGYYNIYTNGAGTLYAEVWKDAPAATWVLYSTTTILPVNQWSHVAITWNSGTENLVFYVNRNPVSFTTSGNNVTGTENFNIGASSIYNQPFAGNIDEVRVWNIVVPVEDIIRRKNCELAGNETGLVAYYKFNQGNDAANNTGITSLTDATANANNGTLNNFALNGSNSNWLSGSPVITGSTILSAPTANSPQSFCSGTNPTVANLVATGTGTIQWYIASTGGSALSPATTLSNGQYFAADVNTNGCESSRTPVSVTVNTTPAAPIASAQSFCSATNPAVADLVATGTAIQWYSAATGGTALVSTTALTTGTYYVSQTVTNCESGRTAVTVTINNTPNISYTGVAANYCVNTVITSLIPGNTGGAPIGAPVVMVSTFAGSGVFGFAEGTGTAAQFNYPNGLTVDASGKLYVADNANYRIRQITPASVVSTLAGNGVQGFADGPGTTAQFNRPGGVVTDAAGNIYVADNLNHRVRKITPAGVVSTLAGSGIAGFADGTGTAAKFNQPFGITIDASDNLYVADENNHRIRKITPAGVVTTIAGTGILGFADGAGAVAQFNYPMGVAIDASGNVYVADEYNNRIRKINPSGMVSTLAGNGTGGFANGTGTAAQFYYPYAVATDVSGNVFVADLYNHRIRKITPEGVVTTVAGTGAQAFADGTIATAKFNLPTGVTVDASGNLYVADQGNQRIRKITYSNGPAFSISPALPAGLSFDNNTGTISGTPTVVSASTTYTISTGNGCGTNNTSITFSTGGSESIAMTNTTLTANVSGTTYFNSNCSNLIVTVLPNGGSPISGSTTAKVWIEGTQPGNFVKRHYEITPAANAGTATATVTLYFTQSEFNDFNAVNSIKLPTGPADGSGIANLLIEKRAGVSSDGSGLPGTYSGSITTIDPADINIIWNATASRWEVSFGVTGFSGFFTKTNSGTLPVTLLSFSAQKTDNSVLIKWQTTNEININRYEVESSSDGINFVKLGLVAAGNSSSVVNYQLTDNSAWVSEVRYYRLKIIDNDGKYKYSNIVKLSNKQTGNISIYPNPVTNAFIINLPDTKLIHSKATLSDANGKLVKNISINYQQQTVNISELSAGIYMLRLADGTVIKLIKE